MKRLFSVVVLVAVLVNPFAVNAQIAVEFDETAYGVWGCASSEYTVGHKPPEEKGDFGLFPFLGKSFYRFVLKPSYKATKASGKTGGEAVKFFFVQIGHFLF